MAVVPFWSLVFLRVCWYCICHISVLGLGLGTRNLDDAGTSLVCVLRVFWYCVCHISVLGLGLGTRNSDDAGTSLVYVYPHVFRICA